MTKSELFNYISDTEKLDGDTLSQLEEVIRQYPYFQTAHLLLAKNRHLVNSAEFEKYLPETAAVCADRKRLFYLINNEKYAAFFKQEQAEHEQDRTGTLLDSYLTNFSEEENKVHRSEINMVSTDYLTYLEKIEEELDDETGDEVDPKLKHHDIIDSFLEKAETSEALFSPTLEEYTKPTENEPEPEQGGFLTETLSRIYIKQKKYEQALAIIQQLSLNFPKKSSYFADQIRFLELLIINEKNKK